MATIGDEDSATQSSHSSPSTPSISNPGTPRSELTQEVRATPPLPQPPISSSVQRTIPGQLQAQQAQVLVPQSHIQQQQQPLHQLPHQPQSKYSSLLAVIEDMGRDIRPTYAGNRTSSERLKRSIVHARILVRECLMECLFECFACSRTCNQAHLRKESSQLGTTFAPHMAFSERSGITNLQILDTELYADSVEWCPFDGLQNVLLCGTYQLLEKTSNECDSIKNEAQVRVGQLQMYYLREPLQEDEDKLPSLSVSCCVDMSGILDVKWARNFSSSLPLFGLVNASGECQLWKVSDKDENTATTQNESFLNLADTLKDDDCLRKMFLPLRTEKIGDCLALSLDWTGPLESSSPKVVVSDSSGSLSVLEAGNDFRMTSHWHAHDYEAWICASDMWNPEIVYSGSDDCKMKVWDLRVGSQPVKTNSGFDMGVCSIQSNPVSESLLAVGSYDENLRIFDRRNMKQPLSVSSLGGGVWRVKWEPFQANKILTASMHNGFHILDCSLPDSEPLPVLAHYTQHSSLAYGADWCRLSTGSRNARKENDRAPSNAENTVIATECYLISTCSFYDHSLHLWQWTI